MGHGGSGFGCGQGGAAGVGEKIENFYRLSGLFPFFYNRRKPVPVYGLLREKPCVLEAERFQAESKLPVPDAPFLGQLEEFPLSAAFGTAVIVSVLLFPAPVCARRVPYDLRVGAHQDIIAPALQLLPAGGIYYFIIFPCICCPHCFTFLRRFARAAILPAGSSSFICIYYA